MIRSPNIFARTFLGILIGIGIQIGSLHAADTFRPAQQAPKAESDVEAQAHYFFSEVQSSLNRQQSVFPSASCNLEVASQVFKTQAVALRPLYDGNSPWRVDPDRYLSTSRNTFVSVKFENNDQNQVNRAEVEFRKLCDLSTNREMGAAELLASGGLLVPQKGYNSAVLEIPLRNLGLRNHHHEGLSYPKARIVGLPGKDGRTMVIFVSLLDSDSPNGENRIVDQVFAFKP